MTATRGILLRRVAYISSILLVSAVAAACLWWNVARQLDRSLHAVFGGAAPVYEVQGFVRTGSLTDPGAEWWVTTERKAFPALKDAGKADAADTEFFRQVVIDAFGRSDLSNYELLRAEQTLGPGSICQQSPCNIYVLRSLTESAVFIGIYKY